MDRRGEIVTGTDIMSDWRRGQSDTSGCFGDADADEVGHADVAWLFRGLKAFTPWIEGGFVTRPIYPYCCFTDDFASKKHRIPSSAKLSYE